MKARRKKKLLVEPPASAMGDISFNLIVFFLVCASVQPDSGRKQTIPKSEKQKEELVDGEEKLKESDLADLETQALWESQEIGNTSWSGAGGTRYSDPD